MKTKKKWMIVWSKQNSILLHHNEELPQYKKFKRVPDKIIRDLKRGKK